MQLYHVAHVPLPTFRLPGMILIGLPVLNTIALRMSGY
jgi:hypothetical protein